jgi:hypothetical protein
MDYVRFEVLTVNTLFIPKPPFQRLSGLSIRLLAQPWRGLSLERILVYNRINYLPSGFMVHSYVGRGNP